MVMTHELPISMANIATARGVVGWREQVTRSGFPREMQEGERQEAEMGEPEMEEPLQELAGREW
jgi:hypothetical protein